MSSKCGLLYLYILNFRFSLFLFLFEFRYYTFSLKPENDFQLKCFYTFRKLEKFINLLKRKALKIVALKGGNSWMVTKLAIVYILTTRSAACLYQRGDTMVIRFKCKNKFWKLTSKHFEQDRNQRKYI